MEQKDNMRKEIEQKERELSQIKYNLKQLEEKENKDKLALEYFKKNFKLSMISDDYNICPQDIFTQIEGRFMRDFSIESKEYNKNVLDELRKDYIEYLKSDVRTLLKSIEEIEEQFKELQK